MFEHRFGEIAVRIEECKSLAGGDVLRNEVQEQGALTRPGLPDDVEVPPACLPAEHGEIARNAGTEVKILW
jgi:hypothetical protein